MKILILSLFLATLSLVGCKPTERIIEVPVEVTKYVQRSDTVQVYSTDRYTSVNVTIRCGLRSTKRYIGIEYRFRVDTVPKVGEGYGEDNPRKENQSSWYNGGRGLLPSLPCVWGLSSDYCA